MKSQRQDAFILVRTDRTAVYCHFANDQRNNMVGDDSCPRLPNEWFNPLLEQTLPELADKLAETNADPVLNATRMIIR